MKKLLYAWVPVIAWMLLIFYASSKQRITISNTYFFNFIFFKILHVVEYGILYLLIYRAFYLVNNKNISTLHIGYSFLISLIYAVTDELHQTFVPTREGRFRDIFIDMIGIVCMMTIIKKYEKNKRIHS